jgi:thermitase
MRMRRLSLALLVVTVVSAPAWALNVVTMKKAVTAQGVTYDSEVIAGQAVVKFKVGTSSAVRDTALAGVGATFVRDLAGTGWSVVSYNENSDVASKIGVLEGLSIIEGCEPNHAYRINKVPSDPLAASNYHLGLVNAYSAWEYETGSSSETTVAVLDAGIDTTHTDLSAKTAGMGHQFCDPGANKSISGDNTTCVSNNNPHTAACNHGTRVAGIAAASANNGIQGVGLSWEAKLLSMKIFRDGDCAADCSGGGCATDDQAIVDALNFVRSSHNITGVGRVVANLSIGGVSACAAAVQTAIDNAVNAGVVVVVSAGNYGGSTNGGPVQSPGNCNNVITVGATDSADNIAGFSARGSEMAVHGVVAPGVGVPTTDLGGGTASPSGTSFSAPIVSGLAALILAAKPTATVSVANNEVLTILRNSAQGIGISGLSVQGATPQGNTVGAGRVSAFRALKLTVDGTLSGFQGDQKAIAFPNPFRPGQHGLVTITIPTAIQGTNAMVKIYTIDGQLVRDLGANTSWDGKNGSGNNVATGTYIFLVKTDSGDQTGRVAVIR